MSNVDLRTEGPPTPLHGTSGQSAAPHEGIAPHRVAPSDADQLARFALAHEGSSDALGELLATCRGYLLLVANLKLGESLQAKLGASDLVQETFVEAQRIFDRFNGNSERELLAWLVAILENKLGNTIKRYQYSAKRDVARELPLGLNESSAADLQLVAAGESPSE